MKSNFLLHVPLCIDPFLRTRWNGIGFSLQSLKMHYSNMLQAAPVIVEAENKISSGHLKTEEWPDMIHIAMFSYAWAMVDQIYAVSSIARGLKIKQNTPFSKFLEKSGDACIARNHLDHLHQRIDNFIKREKQTPPLFGSLSFHHIKKEDMMEGNLLKGATIITLMSMMSDKQSMQVIAQNRGHSYQVESPNGCFELQIEGVKIALSEAYRDALEVEEYFNTEVRDRIEATVRKEAIAEGFDPDEALAQTTGLGLTMRADLVFRAGSEETTEMTST